MIAGMMFMVKATRQKKKKEQSFTKILIQRKFFTKTGQKLTVHCLMLLSYIMQRIFLRPVGGVSSVMQHM